eukprot:5476842-Amphidinium_carterae.1
MNESSPKASSDVDLGRITTDDLHGNGQADVLANQGIAAHGPLEPDDTWTRWADFANKMDQWSSYRPSLQLKPQRFQSKDMKLTYNAWSVVDKPAKGTCSSVYPPVGEAIGGAFPLASEQRNRGPGDIGPLGGAATGRTVAPATVVPGHPANPQIWPIFRRCQQEPD